MSSTVLVFVLLLLLACMRVSSDEVECQQRAFSESRSFFQKSECRAQFDESTVTWTWMGDDGVRKPVVSKDALQQLRGSIRDRRVLFIGDSTSRNPALVMAALVCNPESFGGCQQRLTVFAPDAQNTPLLCNVSSTSGTCSSDILGFSLPIKGLTAMQPPPNKAARRAMWRSGLLPPLSRVVIKPINATIDIAEAGCKPEDGIGHVVDVLGRTRLDRIMDDGALAKQVFPDVQERVKDAQLDQSRPGSFFEQYDVVVVAGGLHCSRAAWGSFWYIDLANRTLPQIARTTPVVVAEPTNCLKIVRRALPGKPVGCNQLPRHMPYFRVAMMGIPGVTVASTRGITSKAGFSPHSTRNPVMHVPTLEERRKFHCAFADSIHPGIECYAPIAMSLASSIDRAISSFGVLKSEANACLGSQLPNVEGSPFGRAIKLRSFFDDQPQTDGCQKGESDVLSAPEATIVESTQRSETLSLTVEGTAVDNDDNAGSDGVPHNGDRDDVPSPIVETDGEPAQRAMKRSGDSENLWFVVAVSFAAGGLSGRLIWARFRN